MSQEALAGKAQVRQLWADVSVLFEKGARGRELVRHMSDGVDTLLKTSWQQHAGEVADLVDIVLVGGNGRQELCPGSDWDIWFLIPAKAPDAVQERINSFMYLLWDTGAKVGHAVRSVEESIQHFSEDWDSATAATEARLLTGKGELFAVLQRECSVFFEKYRKAFTQAKLDEFSARHRKVGDTAFLMEPDLKEGKGALRDIQAVFWMARVWYGVSQLQALVEINALSSREMRQLNQAQDFFWRCRTGLHLESKRASDRLGFEQQAALAERMGYQASGGQPAVDVFMKHYFRHAGRVARISGMLVQHFEEQLHPPRFYVRRKEVGDGFVSVGKQLDVLDDQVFDEEPLRLLRVFLVSQEQDKELSSHALRLLREKVTVMDAGVRRDAEAGRLFLEILKHPRHVGRTLKQMNNTGVLGRLIPDFRRVVGLGQFNRYHAYTVDEHTIRAVCEARNQMVSHHGLGRMRLQLAADLMGVIGRPEVLYLALLFHDIAKGREGDHSIEGEKLARRFCRSLSLSRDTIELIAWLVRYHLEMAMVSQRSDLSDPEVIRNFASFVGDMERLQYLFLLTVADISAVGPEVWNDWKGALLRELYEATERALKGDVMPDEALESRIRTRIESAIGHAEPEERPRLAPVFNQIHWRCVMDFQPRQLLPIARLFVRADGEEAVDTLIDDYRKQSLVIVLAKERKGLFARLAATISSGFVNIVAAHAYALADGRVLDVFHVVDAQGRALEVESDLLRLRERIEMILNEAGDQVLTLPKLPAFKQNVLMRKVKVRARELPFASSRQTAIEVEAADRPGLLASLAFVISQMSYDIRGAAISTFGEKAVDVFFLRSEHDEPLHKEEITLLCQRLQEAARLPEDV